MNVLQTLLQGTLAFLFSIDLQRVYGAMFMISQACYIYIPTLCKGSHTFHTAVFWKHEDNSACVEGEYEDWLLDTVGLFVWIATAGIACLLGRFSWWCWCSIKEDPRMAKSLSKQDLFTL